MYWQCPIFQDAAVELDINLLIRLLTIMRSYGIALNQSQYTLVSEGGAKIFDKKTGSNSTLKPSVVSVQRPSIKKSSIDTTQSQKTLLSHQYLVKKYGNKLPGGETFNIDDLIKQISDVFCIVCEQYISESKIDQHCKYCQVKTQNEIEQVEDVQQKLTKCNYLLSRIKKMLKLYCTDKQQVIQYLQMLWKCVTDIIQSTSEKEILQLIDDLELFTVYFNEQQADELSWEKLLQQIMTVLAKVGDFSNRKLHLLKQNNKVQDFLKMSLAQQNIQGVRNPFDEIENITKGRSKAFETSFANQQQFSVGLHQSFQPYQSDKHGPFDFGKGNAIVIEELEESCVRDNDFISNAFRAVQQPPNQPKGQPERRQAQPQVINHPTLKKEDNKTRFFNLAAEMKENYPLDHPAQTILVAGLYEKANRTGVPPQQYEEFIARYYDQS